MKRPVTARQSALIEQGIALQNKRRFVDAERLYQSVLRENPEHTDALNLMGVLAIEAGQNTIARQYHSKAVALAPGIAMYRNNLGNTLIICSRSEEALPHLRKAVQLDPRYAEAWTNLGKAYRMIGDTAEAAKHFAKALSIDPAFVRAKTGMAEIASETGRFAEAQEQFEKILLLEPHNIEALSGLAQVKKYEPEDPLFARFESVFRERTLRDDERAPLHHAYAKMCNDAGRFDDAMVHFAQGKKLKKLMFHMDLHKKTYAGQKATFTREFFAERKGFGIEDARPVFVVGMPRSGTTLTEQFLSAHASAEGMGELNDMRMIAFDMGYGRPDPTEFTSRAVALSKTEIRGLAERYLRAFSRAPASAIRVIDKSPHNFELLGLIGIMFPNAHIIHCSRDPMDNCVAIYMQNFNEAHGYNGDLATLGTYYKEYQGLMAHWRDVLPLPMFENVYEKTVSDFEEQARAMVQFLGLDWDKNCLNYHQQDRQVRTPSRWQVRQPIYNTSVERWRRYEKHLGPLEEALQIPRPV